MKEGRIKNRLGRNATHYARFPTVSCTSLSFPMTWGSEHLLIHRRLTFVFRHITTWGRKGEIWSYNCYLPHVTVVFLRSGTSKSGYWADPSSFWMPSRCLSLLQTVAVRTHTRANPVSNWSLAWGLRDLKYRISRPHRSPNAYYG